MPLFTFLLLSSACGKSPKDACTAIWDKTFCLFEDAAKQMALDPNFTPELIQVALTIVKSGKEENIDSCVKKYEEKDKKCQESLNKLEPCLAKIECSASQTDPCEESFKEADELKCVTFDDQISNL